MLRKLGWLRLLSSSGLQQPGLGNTAGHTTDSGKDANSKRNVEFYTPAHTNTHSHALLLHRTRPTGSSTGWATLWCLDLRATSGCMEGSLCQRAFWEMSTGMSV